MGLFCFVDRLAYRHVVCYILINPRRKNKELHSLAHNRHFYLLICLCFCKIYLSFLFGVREMFCKPIRYSIKLIQGYSSFSPSFFLFLTSLCLRLECSNNTSENDLTKQRKIIPRFRKYKNTERQELRFSF